jgi:hypothetical protein
MSVPLGGAQQRAEIALNIGLPTGADSVEIDQATARLRRELLELDVDRVEGVAAGEAPVGARAAEVLALGGLIVTLARNAQTITSVVRAVQSWVGRDRDRSIKLELDGDSLEVTGISSTEQERLIMAWIAHHT